MQLRQKRKRAAMAVGVLRDGTREQGYVEDISEGGLRLSGLRNPQIGQILRLHAKGAFLTVQIRWVSKEECGVMILKSATGGELARFLGALNRAGASFTTGQVFREMKNGGG